MTFIGTPTKGDAMKAAEAWEGAIDKEIDWAFREIKGALRSWWTEIFNDYDRPISNAYTESINNLAKRMNRMGRGYSFEVIRARLLFDDEARADTRTTIRKKVRKAAHKPPMVGYTTTYSGCRTASDDTVVEYGPYIPTLARKLEAGDFA